MAHAFHLLHPHRWAIQRVVLTRGNPKHLGKCDVEVPEVGDYEDEIERQRHVIRYRLGGIAANLETMADPPADLHDGPNGWGEDLIWAEGLLKILASNPGLEPDRVFDEELDQTKALVIAYRPAVTAVANELLKRRPEPLPGDEAHKIIAGVSDFPPTL